MKHVPHLVVAAPWDGSSLELSVVQWRHLSKVLRLGRGDAVTYTDGLGIFGAGRLGHQSVERGDETEIERPSNITIAVAPPANRDRQRYLVEKLTELGVARLIWLKTEHGKERVASPAKVFSWVLAATEQSRGAWLMETSADIISMADLPGTLLICHPGGAEQPVAHDILVIGPEGGFAEDEIPGHLPRWDLGPTVLRVETSAVVAAALLRAM